MLNTFFCSDIDNNVKANLNQQGSFVPSEELKNSLEKLSEESVAFFLCDLLYRTLKFIIFITLLSIFQYMSCFSFNLTKNELIKDFSDELNLLQSRINFLEESINSCKDEESKKKLNSSKEKSLTLLENTKQSLKKIEEDNDFVKSIQKRNIFFFLFFLIFCILFALLSSSSIDGDIYFQSREMVSDTYKKNSVNNTLAPLSKAFQEKFNNRFFKSEFLQAFGGLVGFIVLYITCYLIVCVLSFPFIKKFYEDSSKFESRPSSPCFGKKISELVFVFSFWLFLSFIAFYFIDINHFKIVDQYNEEVANHKI